ncbi:MAG: hypothetical protein HY779_01830 [Rubrobacteridae bacterium]|nr:hypothetical protein [Rubrobacteridae bacterium]
MIEKALVNRSAFLETTPQKILTSLMFMFLFVMILMFNCQMVQAAETRSGDTVSVGANQTINDDLYVAGGTISINGQINGDLIVAGGTVSINGSVRDDLIVLGGNVNVNGSVGQSIRVAGGNVVIRSTVGDDIVAAGGTIDVSGESSVKRDIILSGGNVNFNGVVGRNLQGAVGMATVGGTINGDTTLTAGQLTLTKTANLKGNLTYTSENKAKIESGATVSGKTTHKQPPVEKRKPTPGERAAAMFIYFILSFLAAYLFGALLLAILPAQTREIADTVLRKPWASLGIGFLYCSSHTAVLYYHHPDQHNDNSAVLSCIVPGAGLCGIGFWPVDIRLFQVVQKRLSRAVCRSVAAHDHCAYTVYWMAV